MPRLHFARTGSFRVYPFASHDNFISGSGNLVLKAAVAAGHTPEHFGIPLPRPNLVSGFPGLSTQAVTIQRIFVRSRLSGLITVRIGLSPPGQIILRDEGAAESTWTPALVVPSSWFFIIEGPLGTTSVAGYVDWEQWVL